MVKLYEVKETTADSSIIGNMHSIRILIQDIIRAVECKEELNYDDYIFTNTTLKKVKKALQKVDSIIKI